MPNVTVGPFSIEAPKDWTLKTVILAGPVASPQSEDVPWLKPVGPFQQNLVVTMEQVGDAETAESYVHRQTEDLTKAGVNWRRVKAPERVTLRSELEGSLTEQVMVGPDGLLVRQMQLVSINAGVAYTLILTHLDGPPFEGAREGFKNILLSFAVR
jgi:hypothetical protein